MYSTRCEMVTPGIDRAGGQHLVSQELAQQCVGVADHRACLRYFGAVDLQPQFVGASSSQRLAEAGPDDQHRRGMPAAQ